MKVISPEREDTMLSCPGSVIHLCEPFPVESWSGVDGSGGGTVWWSHDMMKSEEMLEKNWKAESGKEATIFLFFYFTHLLAEKKEF